MGEILYLYLYLLLFFFIATSPLVGAQIVMARLYGLKGLAFTTTAVVCVIIGGGAMLVALERGYLVIGPRPRGPERLGVLEELAVGFTFLLPLSFWVPLLIVLVVGILLAFTVKTE